MASTIRRSSAGIPPTYKPIPSSTIFQAGFFSIADTASSFAFVVGRIDTVSFGYSLVFSGFPSGAVPAGGLPIFGVVFDLMTLEYSR